ncbi:MAG: acyl-ACP--UDP-N-acetylglucosamine O-acyltransferase [Bacteroidetes bacterium]|nr:acyl-ACP--UDP-N-acetylglucosamine O-acyltransferase [Bacteroidota bacterium]
MRSESPYIHPDARIGKNVVIEPFSYIAGDVKIGDSTWIGPNVTIMSGARIGRKCRIFPGAVISAIPQDLKYTGEESTAEIGDNTTIRECVTVNRGTKVAYKTVVGNNTLLMAYVHIAHDCVVGNNCILVNSVGLAGEVIIDDWAILGGATVVHQYVNIGGHVMIGGGSKVRKDVPPYVRVDRDPLTYLGINSIGLTRRNFSKEKIEEIHNIYRWIYQKGLNYSQAMEKIENEMPATPELDYILSFIKKSERGIIGGER